MNVNCPSCGGYLTRAAPRAVAQFCGEYCRDSWRAERARIAARRRERAAEPESGGDVLWLT